MLIEHELFFRGTNCFVQVIDGGSLILVDNVAHQSKCSP